MLPVVDKDGVLTGGQAALWAATLVPVTLLPYLLRFTTGTYAIAVYHDADSNRSFNRTGIGLPEEGFGFSNNPGTLFGLPSFRSVRLAVPRSDMQTTVRIRYP